MLPTFDICLRFKNFFDFFNFAFWHIDSITFLFNTFGSLSRYRAYDEGNLSPSVLTESEQSDA